ncbi:MAG TPA: hypothetical protein VGL22_06605 [Terracidiphilus sp.]
MSKGLIAAGSLAALMCVAGFAHAAPPAKAAASNSLVIVLKDGHRQTFNMADVDRIEYPGGSVAASDLGATKSQLTARGRYVGKWQVGDGNGNDFYITLNDNGTAYRSLGDVHGHWVYSNGDALIKWDDGGGDAIRRVGARFQKFAYMNGKSFSDSPDNVAEAHNTSPRPI